MDGPFSVSCAPLSMLGGVGEFHRVPPGPPGKDNGAHGTEKFLLNSHVREDFASDVNLPI